MSQPIGPFRLLQELGFRSAILGPADSLRPLDVIFRERTRTGEGINLRICPLKAFSKTQTIPPPTLRCDLPLPNLEGVCAAILHSPASILVLEALAAALGSDSRRVKLHCLRDLALRLRYLKVSADSVSDEEAREYFSEVLRSRYPNESDPWPMAVVTEVLRAAELSVEFVDSCGRAVAVEPDAVSSETGLTCWSKGGAHEPLLFHPTKPLTIGFKLRTCHSMSYSWDGRRLAGIYPSFIAETSDSLVRAGLATQTGFRPMIRSVQPFGAGGQFGEDVADFIIMPRESLSADPEDLQLMEVFARLEELPRGERMQTRFAEETSLPLAVIDSVGLLGPQWVQMRANDVARLRNVAPGVRVEP